MRARPLPEKALHKTPLHDRTAPLCHTFRWSAWNGFATVAAYVDDREEEYFALVNRVGVLDHCPLRKVDLEGADAGPLLGERSQRDVTAMPIGGLMHAVLISELGSVRDCVWISRMSAQTYRVVGSERNAAWFDELGAGADMSVRDRDDLGVVALRGPMAARVVTQMLGRLVAVRSGEAFAFEGVSGWVQRQSTEQFALHIPLDSVGTLWDLALSKGSPLGGLPCGYEAEEALRIASGQPRWGVDYIGSAQTSDPHTPKTPAQAGLASLTPVEADATSRRLVSVEITWEHLANLYAEYGTPRHWLAGERTGRVPVYDGDGRRCIGQLTSATWCAARQTLVGIADVAGSFAATGTRLRVEHTVRFERRQLPATVVRPPWLTKTDIP